MLDEIHFAELLVSYLKKYEVAKFSRFELEELVVKELGKLPCVVNGEHVVSIAIKALPNYLREDENGNIDIIMDPMTAANIIDENEESEIVEKIAQKFVNSIPGAIEPKQLVTLLIARKAVLSGDKYVSVVPNDYVHNLLDTLIESSDLYEYRRFLPYMEVEGIKYMIDGDISGEFIRTVCKEFQHASASVPKDKENVYFELTKEQYDAIINGYDVDTIELIDELMDIDSVFDKGYQK